MRWYFAIDEGGARGITGDMARLAVLSARMVGGLEPVLLYHGGETEFCAWMRAHGVRIIQARPRFWDDVERAMAAGTYRPFSIGHWLRLEIPLIEMEEEFVLYTDCDVIFLHRIDFSRLRPKIFAAAPETKPDAWNYLNAGVILMNVPAMRETYPALEEMVKSRIADGRFYLYNDQIALNEAYAGLWERLPANHNQKPYWPLDTRAPILHYHGPKPDFLASMALGKVRLENEVLELYAQMLAANAKSYLDWSLYLGDRLQVIDMGWALRFVRLANALTSYMKAS